MKKAFVYFLASVLLISVFFQPSHVFGLTLNNYELSNSTTLKKNNYLNYQHPKENIFESQNQQEALVSNGLLDEYIWNDKPNITAENLNDIFFLSSNLGWSVGNQGTILHYGLPEYRLYLPIILNGDLPENMVYVPAGEFQMGCDPAHNSGVACPADELPLHTVYLDAYYIDINHVTNAQYAQCVDDGVCFLPSDTYFYDEPGFENHPVVWVNWVDAMTYCDWMGKDLPTEAQWEKAARGTTVRTFPWGDNPATCDLANYENCVNMTTIVGSYPDGASPYGVLDMAGNVYDWVYDWYLDTEYEDRACGTVGLPVCNNPTGPTFGYKKGLRGGSYMWSSASICTHRRGGEDGWSGAALFGFRCASTAP